MVCSQQAVSAESLGQYGNAYTDTFTGIKSLLNFNQESVNNTLNVMMLEGAVHTQFDRFKLALQPTSVEFQYRLWHLFPTGLPLYAHSFPQDSVIIWHELCIYIGGCSQAYRLSILAFCSWRSGYLSGTRPRLVAVESPWRSRTADVLFQTELTVRPIDSTVHGEIINKV